MYNTIVVGGGPAGITLAVNLKRSGRSVLIIEKNALGGQINSLERIANFPTEDEISGIELGKKFSNYVKRFDVEVKYENVIDIEFLDLAKVVKTKKNKYECKNLVLACGLSPKKAKIENEDLFFGKGVSYCATCDGYFYKNKTVVVISKNGSGINSALYLANICDKVYLFNEGIMPRLALKNNIIIHNDLITKISGEENLNRVYTQGGCELTVSGLFVCLGYEPKIDFLKGQLKMQNGFIVTKMGSFETSLDMVYAIGDIRSESIKQIVSAEAEGVACAKEIIKKDN